MTKQRASYNPSIIWESEKVRRGDIHPNMPYYLEDPLKGDTPVCYHDTAGPDAMVWIVYVGKRERADYFRKDE